jgi:hypothetical protein
MIDNPEQVERLVSKLRESLPLVAMLTPEVAAIVREQSPAVERSQGFAITRVDYAGDEGGIVCKVELGPNNEDRALFASITHLRFDQSVPVGRESISAWMLGPSPKAEGAIEDMRKTRAEMLESVWKLVAEYSEFQRRRPDLPQGNLWGLSQDELEKVVAAFQLEMHSDADIDMSDPAPPAPKPQIH